MANRTGIKTIFFAVASFALATTGTVNAQTCSTLFAVGGATAIAQEDTTALLPQVQVFCDQGTVGAVTITLISNAPFTMASPGGTLDVKPTATISATGTTFAPKTVSLGSSNTLNVFVDFSPTAPLYGFTISNLRVNASGLPGGAPVTLGAVVVSQVTGGLTSNNASSTVQPTPVAYVSPSNLMPVITGAPNFAACPANLNSKTPVAVANVTLQEAFSSAFKAPGDDQGTSAGAAQATRLAVTFNNLLQGVNYYVPATVKGTGNLSLTAYTSGTASSPAPISSVGTNNFSFVATSGSATIYYVVTADNPAVAESAAFTLSEIPTAPQFATSDQGTPISISQAPSPVTVSVALASTGATYPVYSNSAAVLTGIQPVVTGSNGILLTCQTTILFPFATNQLGFDTGIVVVDPSLSASGTCTLNFYGFGEPTPALGVPSPAGSTSVANPTSFILSSVAAGFQGLVIVQCPFPGAKPYSFLSYDLAQNNGVADNGSAIVINNNGIPANTVF